MKHAIEKDYNQFLVDENITIKEALKVLDVTAEKTLLVVDKERRLLGTLTDGDVRRYILSGRFDIEQNIKSLYNRHPIYASDESNPDTIRRLLLENRITLVPLIDRGNRVVGYTTWGDAFSEETPSKPIKFAPVNVPVAIMAGGVGSRLDPFTKIIPKPLMPIGDRSILEMIVDNFRRYGVKDFYVTLNYKGEMIRAYLESIERDYSIRYVFEEKFLGTAGSLRLLPDWEDGPLIVTNCDILVSADYSEILDHHRECNSEFTIVSSLQHFRIPYGVIKFGINGEVFEITEKPEYSFMINTGVYIIERSVLDLIPECTRFDMNQVITGLMQENRRVVTFPVNDSDYSDIGQIDEYKATLQRIISREV